MRNPKAGEGDYFTEDAAWAFIAELVESGHEIEVLSLDNPPGKKGYVMKAPSVGNETIYIKFMLGDDCVYGRSFHPSTRK